MRITSISSSFRSPMRMPQHAKHVEIDLLYSRDATIGRFIGRIGGIYQPINNRTDSIDTFVIFSVHPLPLYSRLCGQVVCSDCSRVRVSLPTHFKEREVRLCVECCCQLTAEYEGIDFTPIHQFVHTQLRAADFGEEKLQLATQLQILQLKMKESEKELFSQPTTVSDETHNNHVDGSTTKDIDTISVAASIETLSPSVESSSDVASSVVISRSRSASASGSGSGSGSNSKAASKSSSRRSSHTATIDNIPPTPSVSPFIAAMKSYAHQMQMIQSQLSELQIKGGLLVQVIFTNINSSAIDQVWNNQNVGGNGIVGSTSSSNESSLNAGLYRYLLILPPPHRLIAMTSLLFPPTPSVFKKTTQPALASIAIQNQLHSLHLPPNLLDAPIEVAREFFSVFSTDRKAGASSKNSSAASSPKVVEKDTATVAAASTSEQSSTTRPSSSPSSSPYAIADSNEKSDDPPSSSKMNGVDVTPNATTSSSLNNSITSSPSDSSVPSVAIPTSSSPPADSSSSPPAPLAPAGNGGSGGFKLRFYNIRSLDSISSIRPLDFRSSSTGSVHRGFTINFHPHAAPGPAGLMDSITNRRDEDVLQLYKQPWNCIIVDEQFKRVHGRFKKAIAREVERLEPELVKRSQEEEKETDNEREDTKITKDADTKQTIAQSQPPASTSPLIDGSAAKSSLPPSSIEAESSNIASANSSSSAKPSPTSSPVPSTLPHDKSSASTPPLVPVAQPLPPPVSAPAPVVQSSSSGFFSSIMSVFNRQLSDAKKNMTSSAPSSSSPNGTSSTPSSSPPAVAHTQPVKPTAAQIAAAAAAELSYQVQQEAISSIHASSVSYYSNLIECEKQHVRDWMADMKTTVSWDNPDHVDLLQRLWSSWAPILSTNSGSGASTPVTSNVRPIAPPFPGPISEDWKLLGFQGTNPQTDFRGVGLLSLKVLVYLGERYPQLIDVLMSLQSPSLPHPREYPLACAGINLVCAVMNLLDLNAPLGSSQVGSNQNSIQPGSGTGIRPEAGPTTQLLNNLNQTISNVTAKLLNKDDATGEQTVTLTPHQQHLATLWQRVGKNRLFRLFVRNKSRIGTTKVASSSSPNDSKQQPTVFQPASQDHLRSIDSVAELLYILFPLLDSLWVEEDAGYFQFNAILRHIIHSLEYVLVRKFPRDLAQLESSMRQHIRSERLERVKQKQLQAALAEKQREQAIKKHQQHHHQHAHKNNTPTTAATTAPTASNSEVSASPPVNDVPSSSPPEPIVSTKEAVITMPVDAATGDPAPTSAPAIDPSPSPSDESPSSVASSPPSSSSTAQIPASANVAMKAGASSLSFR